MIKKLIRGLVTIIGAAFGYGCCLLMGYWINHSGGNVDEYFSSGQQMGIAIAFAIIFGIIFFKLTPVLSRQSTKVANNIESDLQGISGNVIVAGTIGLIAGLLIALLLTQMFTFITNKYVYSFIIVITYFIFGYLGVVIATSKGKEMAGNILAPRGKDQNQNQSQGGSRFARAGKKKSDAIPKIFDTSVIIDGRIAEIMKTGFLEGPIVIPEFVLVELRHIADSSDSLKRTRGRRGLDILNKIQKDYGVEIYNTDTEKALKEIPEVDVKLLKLAQLINGKVVTNDFNLNKVAAINGVSVLNINELANCLKPVVLPGEEMTVSLVKQGKDQSQAIGYLDDGTMIVVEDGRKQIGKTTKINVTSVLQTSAGRMIFGRLKNTHVQQ